MNDATYIAGGIVISFMIGMYLYLLIVSIKENEGGG
jgi:hypothetical protein